MRTTNLFRLGVVALGLTLVAAACGDDDDGAAAPETTASTETTASAETTAGGGGEGGGVTCDNVTIASFQALSGEAAGLGRPIKQGAELAVEQFNEANPDCQVNFQPEDSQGSPDQAPGLAKKLVDQADVIGVVGPAFSGESDASGPTFSEAGLITVSPSATRVDLTEKGYKSFVRILGTDGVQGPGLARYIESLDPATVAVIDDASAYGKGLADIVRAELGDKVTVNDTIDPEAQDYSAAVTKVNSESPDVVFYGGYYEAAGRLAKQLRDAGVESVLVFGDGVKDQGFIDAGGAASEGAVISCTCAPAEALPDGAAFVEAYTEKFGEAPGTYAAEAYDAANMLLSGIAEGITDRAGMLDYIRNIDFQGITKRITFTEAGEIDATTVYLFEVQDGAIVGTGEI